jgi:S-ribosylhomocysteine lyase
MEKNVESFKLDHRMVKAPYVRLAEVLTGPKGDLVTKFDLRLVQPNTDTIPTGALHTLEHLLAGSIREDLDNVIDLSPMGCRTGFYLIVFGQPEPEQVRLALEKGLNTVLETTEIPAANPIQCGTYRDHSLFGAKEYARQVLEQFTKRDRN